MLVFSARDFGAKGDGVTDDTAAIQAALDAAEAAGGGVVHLEAGTYIVSGSGKASSGCLQVGSNAVLAGDGAGVTVVKLADDTDSDVTGIIRTPSSQVTGHVTIRDLTIDGNRDNTSGDVDGIFTGVAPGVDAASHDIVIDGVEIVNVSRYAFDPHEQTEHLVIVDSVAHHNGKDGFTLDYISDSVIAGNLSYDNGRHGFNLVTSSHDVLLANNVAHDNGSVGLVVQNGSEARAWVDDVLVAGGAFYDNALQGVLIKLSSDVTVAGTEIFGNGEDGVMVHGAIGTAILDNEIHDNSVINPGYYDGVRLLDYFSGKYSDTTGALWPVEDTTIAGNTIFNSDHPLMGDGISLEADAERVVRLGDNAFTNLDGEDLNLDNAIVKSASVGYSLAATPGTDRLVGTTGDDSVEGGGGNDFIDGRGGDDEARYAGTLDRYDIIFLNDGSIIVRDRDNPVGGDGIDVLVDVEWLNFDGAAWSVDELRLRDKSLAYGAFFYFKGGEGSEIFVGGVEADRLDGGGGADTLIGGDGDDTYLVDHVSDRLIEHLDGGSDTVTARLDHCLTDHVEHLILAGAAVRGWGNALDNEITGSENDNEIKGYAGNDFLDGRAGDDRLYAYEDDDVLLGGAGTDELNAGDGADTLDGGRGADVMRGGRGDDTYLVDDAGDAVVEYNGGGTDTVEAAIDFTLPQKVENLVLVGSAAVGIGNALDNRITGNAADNALDGGAGADDMAGGRGDDTYVVDNVGDKVTEARGEGYDAVQSSVHYALGEHVEALTLAGDGDTAANGNARDNVITGNSGDNRIDGGGGADHMAGGDGDDRYVVDSKYDKVIEAADAGTDLIVSSVDFTLGAYIENLTLNGTAAKGVGNGLDNAIRGNAAGNLLYGLAGDDRLDGKDGTDILYGGDGADRLDGGDSGDRMSGGNGDDLYIVDSAEDVITEFASDGKGGTDTVFASVSFALPDHVENLTLLGGDELIGTGNRFANRIEGNDAANRLAGLGGDDVLIGRGGADVFAFAGEGRDTVRDLDVDQDRLDFRGTAIASRAELIAAATANEGGVVIDLGGSASVTLIAASLDDLHTVGLILA